MIRVQVPINIYASAGRASSNWVVNLSVYLLKGFVLLAKKQVHYTTQAKGDICSDLENLCFKALFVN